MNRQATSTWDVRLVRGLMGMGAPNEVADALVTTLGAIGCEAEYGLSFLQQYSTVKQPTQEQGQMWLKQCYGLGQRLIRAADDLELALQTYLATLVAADPTLAATPDMPTTPASIDAWSVRFDATPDVWWPERGEVTTDSEPIEVWLRRAGFAYRHTVSVGLPGHVEALTDSLNFLLHALQTLPPRGVLTRISLLLGLQAISGEIEGDLIPHHIRDLDQRHVGLLTGIETIARLAMRASNAVESDIVWARGELGRARMALGGKTQHGVIGARVTRLLSHPTGNLWARQLVAEWEHTVAQLEAIRDSDQAVGRAR